MGENKTMMEGKTKLGERKKQYAKDKKQTWAQRKSKSSTNQNTENVFIILDKHVR